MKHVRAILWFGALAVWLGSSVALGKPVDDLVWRQNKSVDAALQSWPLKKVLSRLSAASGWKVYVDPSLEGDISVKFTNVSQSEALRLLLGNLNYALVPDAKNGSKLYVYKTNLREATALVAPDAASKPRNWLANEILLTATTDSKEDMEKLAAELGGKIVAKSDALNTYRLQFPDAESAQAAREKLSTHEGLGTQDNYSFDRPNVGSAGTASPAAMFPLDSKPVARGDQVTVALVDTAIQPLEGKMKDFILPSVHVAGEPASLPGDPTHATSMAETLLNSMVFTKGATENAGTLGTVRVLPIDIYGNSPSTTTFEVAQGLYKAIQSGAQVVNLSLGGTGESPMVDYLLQMARQKEILVFASAGNSPTTDLTWPAANPNAIAVTAADSRGNIASYANRGSFVDVKAPGTSRVYYNGQSYISTGTSTATAFISGQAAGLAAQGFTSAQTADLILKNFDVNATPAPRAPGR